MNIAVLGIRGFPNIQGGVEKHCEELYPRLSKWVNEIIVFNRSPYFQKNRKFSQWKGIKFIHLWCLKIKSLETILHTLTGTIVCILKRPDIIHFHNIGPALYLPIVKLFKMRTVLTYHSINYEHQKWGGFARCMLKVGEKLGCKYADEIIAISSGIKEQVKDKFKREAHLIPNGVVIPIKREETDYVESLGIVPGKYILAVARFVPEKGLHNLLAAYSKVDTDWQLAIAGDADHETEYSRNLKMMAKDTKNVILTGFITGEPLEELYSHAGIFVLPSYYEGLPIVLLEALSYGLSVLVSDIPPNKEVQLAEERYYPVGDETELARKLEYWIRRGPLSDEEQEEQLEMVRQRYDWDKIAEETLKVYEAVGG